MTEVYRPGENNTTNIIKKKKKKKKKWLVPTHIITSTKKIPMTSYTPPRATGALRTTPTFTCFPGLFH